MGVDTKNLILEGIAAGLGAVSIIGDKGAETLGGTDASDKIIGGAGDDILKGAGGSDVLDGGAGNDRLEGGKGNDFYFIDKGDTVAEAAGAGIDEVFSVVDYKLDENIENGTLLGSAKKLTGNAAQNILTGSAGSNILDGGAGNDTMIGGKGDDVYVVDQSNLENGRLVAGRGDQIVEFANDGSKDQVNASVDFSLEGIVEVENLTLLGGALGIGNERANIITGNDGNNELRGGAGNDKLIGGGGADILDGGSGDDQMFGGAGNDTYIVDSIKDKITESKGAKGAPVDTDLVISSVSFKLGTGIENLTLSGGFNIDGFGNAANNVIHGNSGNNKLLGDAGDDKLFGEDGNDVLDGGKGNDELTGGRGNDTYILDSINDKVIEKAGEGTDTIVASLDAFNDLTKFKDVENLILAGKVLNGTGNELDNFVLGNAGKNSLVGNDGNDTLDGGKGADSMTGGKGNDIYVIDDKLDSVHENAGEGIDTIVTVFDTVLQDNFENLTLAGKATRGTGNAADNVITGNALANVLDGGAGNDTLNGGSGADTLIGGTGNDTYVIDNKGDVIDEKGGKEDDADTVVSFLESFELGGNAANIENLVLQGIAVTGTGNDRNNRITGSNEDNKLFGLGGDDVLDGGAGKDQLSGGTGNDTYVVDDAGDRVIEAEDGGTDTVLSSVSFDLGQNAAVENIVLTGAANIDAVGSDRGNNLTGNDGDNRLDGGKGADTLAGGKGNDTYVVDDDADVVTEAADGGRDTVVSSRNYALGANLENLTLSDDLADPRNSPTSATGNELDNTIVGNNRDNFLDGGAGDDTLSGGLGRDAMQGGAGNDTYIVDNVGDRIVEAAGAGVDTVISSVDAVLADNVENLILGAGAQRGIGNALDNVIVGNVEDGNILLGEAGNDTLDGGAGKDILAGGTGDDTYVVDDQGDQVFELKGEGHDTVRSSVDFSLAENRAEIEDLVLTGGATIGVGNDADNRLVGNDGNNLLIGGKGNDTLVGGKGDDIYVVDSRDDVVVEDADGGFDVVLTSDRDFKAGDGIERVIYIGEGGGAGNELNIIRVGVADAQVQEPATGQDRSVMSFDVVLTAPAPEGGIRIPFILSFDGTAVSASADDLANGQSPAGVIVIAAGETVGHIEVAIKGDDLIEGNETFSINLGRPELIDPVLAGTGTVVIVADPTATGTIVDDATDTVPDPDGNGGGGTVLVATLQDGVTVQEPANPGDTATVTLTVTLSGPAPHSGITLDFDVAAAGSGLTAADFPGGVFPHGTVHFNEGDTSATLSFQVAGDALDELDETLTVSLSNPLIDPATNTTVDLADTSLVTILDDAGDGQGGGTPTTLIASLQDGVTVQEPANPGDTATVSVAVTLSGPAPAGGVDIDFDVAPGSGGLTAADFAGGVFPHGTVHFNAGETTATISFQVAGDAIDEGDETLSIGLSYPVVDPATNTVIDVSDTTTVTVIDDTGDTGAATVLVATVADGVTVQEPANPGETATVTLAVTLSGPAPTGGVDIDFAVASASLGLDASDFPGGVFPQGTVHFNAGDTTATISFQVAGDAVDEIDETMTVSLSNPVIDPAANTVINVSDTSVVTILDDAGDAGTTPITLTATLQDGVTVQEPANPGDTATVSVTVTLSGPAPVGGVDIDFGVTPGLGLTADDFPGGVFPSGTVHFNAGDTVATISFQVAGDAIDEGDETLSIGLSHPVVDPATNTVIDVADTSVVTIIDDAGDGQGGGTPTTLVATIEDGVTVQEPANSGETATVTLAVTLSGPAPAGGVDIDFDVAAAGSGLTAADFPGGVFPHGTVHFNAGETTATISFQVAGDAVDEIDETMTVSLSHPVVDPAANTVIDVSDTSVVTIIDDAGDGQGGGTPTTLTATLEDGISVQEPANPGDTATVTLTVTLSGAAPTGGIDIDFAIAAASSGLDANDFPGGAFPSGTVHFAAGATTAALSFLIAGDALREGDEQLTVSLSNPVVAPGANTIVDVSDNAVVTIVDDVADGQGGGTPTTLIASLQDGVTVQEPANPGETATVSVTVTLSGPAPAGGVDIDFAVASASLGLDANDFPGGVFPSGTVHFAAGASTATISFQVAGDAVDELDETMTVSLSHPVVDPTANTVIDVSDTTAVTILDDAGDTGSTTTTLVATLQDGVTVQEPVNAGDTATVSVTVTLSGPAPTGGVDIDFAVASASLGLDASDFPGGVFPTGTVHFNAGETTATISFQVAGDAVDEIDETMTVSLSHPVVDPAANTVIDVSDSTTVTILDDAGDTGSTATTLVATLQDGVTVQEPANPGETATVTLVVTLSGPAPTGGVDIDFAIAPASLGLDANDFPGGVFPSGTVHFAAGASTATISFQVAGDAVDELDETMTVSLSHPVVDPAANTLIDVSDSTTVTILDDAGDTGAGTPTTLVATLQDGVTVQEPVNPGETATVTLTVTLSGPAPTGGIDIDFDVAGFSNGVDAADFPGGVIPHGTLHFNAGETTATFSFGIAGDNFLEGTEAVQVNLRNPVLDPAANTVVEVANAAIVTILDDAGDTRDVNSPTVIVVSTPASITIQEPTNPGDSTIVNVPLTLSGPAPFGGVDIDFVITPRGSVQTVTGDDFPGGVLPQGTIHINAGETTAIISFAVAGDALDEFLQEFGSLKLVDVRFDHATNTTFDFSTVTEVIVLDDVVDGQVTLVASLQDGVTVQEPANPGDTARVTLQVTLSGPAPAGGVDVDFDVAAAGGGLVAADFPGRAFPHGTVHFNAGQSTASITFDVAGDAVDELDETLTVSLGNPVVDPAANTVIDVSDTTTVILLDDAGDAGAGAIALVAAVADGVSVVEPANPGDLATVRIAVTLSGPAPFGGVDIDFDIAPSGAGLDANDFPGRTFPHGTLHFEEGSSRAIISFQVAGDRFDENTETLTIALSNPVTDPAANATVDVSDTTTVSLIDDAGDTGAVTTVLVAALEDGISIQEPANPGETATVRLTVTLSGPAPLGGVDLDFDVSSAGPGLDASDFPGGVLPHGTVHFQEGATTATISFDVAGDAVDEIDETLTVSLGNPVVAEPTTNTAVDVSDTTIVTILDDAGDVAAASLIQSPPPPPPPTPLFVNIDDATVEEPANPGGAATVTLTISLSDPAPGGGLSLDYDVVAQDIGLTARDFVGGVLPHGTIVIPEFESFAFLTFEVAGDRIDEFDEHFSIQLSNPQFEQGFERIQVFLDDFADVTIIDDAGDTGAVTTHLVATLQDGVTIQEPANPGESATVSVTVTLSGPAPFGGVDMHFRVDPADGIFPNNRGLSSSDFVGGFLPQGQVHFDAGATTATIDLQIAGDAIGEIAERMRISLSNPVTDPTTDTVVDVSDSTVVTIQDDPADITTLIVGSFLSPFGAEVDEPGNVGDETSIAIDLTLFTVEGEHGTAPAGGISVDYRFAPGAFGSLTAADFVGGEFPHGTVHFVEGSSTAVIRIAVRGDNFGGEFADRASILFSNPVVDPATQTTVELGSARDLLIRDDPGDAGRETTTLVATIEDGVAVVEPAHPDDTSRVQLHVVLSGPAPAGGITLDFDVTAAGAGLDAGDFPGGVLPHGTVHFQEGSDRAVLSFRIVGDSVSELPESLAVTLSHPVIDPATNTILDVSDTSVVTIAGDAGDSAEIDLLAPPTPAETATQGGGAPTVGIAATTLVASLEDGVTVQEPDNLGEAATVTMHVTLSGPAPVGGVDIDFQVDGFGIGPFQGNRFSVENVDFVNATFPRGTVHFNAGESVATISFQVAGDRIGEIDERMVVSLSNPVVSPSANTVIDVSDTTTATVFDDPSDVTVLQVLPGDFGLVFPREAADVGDETRVTMTVSLVSGVFTHYPAPIGGVSVDFDVRPSAGSRGSAADFPGGVFPHGTVHFAEGSDQATVSFQLAGDRIAEIGDQFEVHFSNPVVNPAQNTVIDTSLIGTVLVIDDAEDAGATATRLVATLEDRVTIVEPAHPGDTARVQLHVSLSGSAPAGGITMDFDVVASSAGLDANDFPGGAFPHGTVHFQEGSDTAVLSFRISGDLAREFPESVDVTLSHPVVDPATDTTVDVSDFATVTIMDRSTVTAGASPAPASVSSDLVAAEEHADHRDGSAGGGTHPEVPHAEEAGHASGRSAGVDSAADGPSCPAGGGQQLAIEDLLTDDAEPVPSNNAVQSFADPHLAGGAESGAGQDGQPAAELAFVNLPVADAGLRLEPTVH